MKEKLINLGLSKNEAIIYLFLLKNPKITTGPIIKETGISNSRVYESLNSLISKGLVNYTIQKDGKYFDASPPEKFLEKELAAKGKIEKDKLTLINTLSTKPLKEVSAVLLAKDKIFLLSVFFFLVIIIIQIFFLIFSQNAQQWLQ